MLNNLKKKGMLEPVLLGVDVHAWGWIFCAWAWEMELLGADVHAWGWIFCAWA